MVRRALAIMPGHAGALANLGKMYHEQRRFEEAIDCYRHAVVAAPQGIQSRLILANLLRSVGRLEECIAEYRALIDLDPDHVEGLLRLGDVLLETERLSEAGVLLRHALTLSPANCDVLFTLGNHALKEGEYHAAEQFYLRSLEQNPAYAVAYANLGHLYTETGQIGKAITSCRKAVELKPEFALGWSNLGCALTRAARHEEALAAYRRAIESDPGYHLAHSNILFLMNYLSEYSQADIYSESCAWNARHGTGYPEIWKLNPRAPLAGRRLRIGFVSADFNLHAVGNHFLPFVIHYDRSRFELFCYSATRAVDELTRTLSTLADSWREVAALNDEELARRVTDDRIDILVDLSGHTAGNRLLAFARKPAPVQATWIGYPTTTGLGAIDFLITDGVTVPDGEDHLFSERVIRLPETRFCYSPPPDAPEPAPPPLLRQECITLGSFNNIAKLSPQTLSLWAELLHAMPAARLLLKWETLAEESVRSRLSAIFSGFGIAPERVEYEGASPHAEMMARYSAVDVALDPFPFSGGATTCEALWMGVPVVTLPGTTPISRQTASFLTCIGHAELIAPSRDAYIRIIRELCAAPGRLADLRSRLRSDMSASLLCDGPRFTCNLERAFLEMWRQVARDESLSGGQGHSEPHVPSAEEERAHAAQWYNSGIDHMAEGDLDAAASTFEEALRCDPGFVPALNNLGIVSFQRGDGTKALHCFMRAVEADPDNAELWNNLGSAQYSLKSYRESIDSFQKAITLRPGYGEAHLALGDAYQSQGLLLDAVRCYRKAGNCLPGSPVVQVNMGTAYLRSGRSESAARCFRRAISLSPDLPDAHFMLGNALFSRGRIRDSIASFRQALQLKLDYAEAHSNMLFSMNYLPEYSQEDLYQESSRWGQIHCAGIPARDHIVRTGDDLPIRIGYVSGDFRRHPVGYHLQPVLEAHSHIDFSIYCYSTVKGWDDLQDVLKSHADTWRDISDMTDDDAAELIERDGIDILVDLAGHTGGGRLRLFTRRPAPVQVSWLGYFNTTGVEAIDYVISDETTIPEGEERWFTEHVVHLPGNRFCYAPPEYAPPVVSPPVVRSGGITFGSFNNISKLTGEVIALWSRVLHAVPDSRLILKWSSLGHANERRRLVQRFGACGIPPERLELRGKSLHADMLAEYGDMDIALDPFPFSGGMTSCEALWMGVPVVTLWGDKPVGRQTAGFLRTIGIPEMIALTPDEYVGLAVNLSGDVERLSQMRRELRDRMRASLLCDGERFTRNLEQVYRTIWEKYRAPGESPECQQELSSRQADPAVPDMAAIHRFNDGVDFMAGGNLDEALACFEEAVTLAPGFAPACNNLGIIRFQRGRMREAAELFRRAAELDRGNPEPLSNLGRVLTHLGEFADASAACRRALELDESFTDAWNNLGYCRYLQRDFPSARSCLDRAISLVPTFAVAVNNLGLLEWAAGTLDRAATCFRRAIRLDARYAEAHGNLANYLMLAGRHREALVSYRNALILAPAQPQIRSNYLFALNSMSRSSQHDIYLESREWESRHAHPAHSAVTTFDTDSSEGRRLTVGLCSPDFRRHSCASFIEPLMRWYDRSRLTVICYADVASPDEYTGRFREAADGWRDVYGMPAPDLAEMIRGDRVDILFDLAGHTAGNRLEMFALKPAPVQVSWLGYPNTTGLSTMDYRITDEIADPVAESGRDHTESLLRLPPGFLCYAPPREAPAVTPLPLSQRGFPTFASFNNQAKITPDVLDVWAALLHRVPDAVLVLKNISLSSPVIRRRVLKEFALRGVEASRLEFLPWEGAAGEHLERYSQVDIALDTFPYNGTTTTFEALWMGVPVVTLRGDRHASRVGASILTRIGLEQFVTGSVEEYLDCAAGIAADPARLAVVRAGLRERLASSPLCDGAGFAGAMEAALRGVWQERCARAVIEGEGGAGESGEAELPGLIERGRQLLGARRFTEAESCLEEAIELYPGDAELYSLLGDADKGLLRFDDAAACYRLAAGLRPEECGDLYKLGQMYQQTGSLPQAVEVYREIVARFPGHAGAHSALGLCLMCLGRLTEAETSCRNAVAENDSSAGIATDLGAVLFAAGQPDEAIGMFRRALAIDPSYARAHSAILFVMNYLPGVSAADIHEEARRWDDRQARFTQGGAAPLPVPRENRPVLRVGFVSPDLGRHPVGYFLLHPLECHDRSCFTYCCYSDRYVEDELTARLREGADIWRVTAGMSDGEVAELIRADGIDILVDLAGHTGRNRLALFAMKPAPVQATWAGYVGTTGLSAMDYLISDDLQSPPDAERYCTERIIRLPRGYVSYAPPEYAPEVGPLPALTNGYVTFGCFNNLAKVNSGVVETWAMILREIPGARLLLKTRELNDERMRDRLAGEFREAGCAPDRVTLEGGGGHGELLASYGRVDIALDPFPYSGGLTTLEALWMGVPVVSLAGDRFCSRHSLTHLHAVGLGHLAKASLNAYRECARELAADHAGLAVLRGTLRRMMAGSPLCDGPGFAAKLQRAFREMWRQACHKDPLPVEAIREDLLSRFEEANGLFGMKKFDEAADVYRDILAEHPEHPRALRALGVVSHLQGDTRSGIELITKSLELKPDFTDARLDLGKIYLDESEYSLAETVFREAIEQDPLNPWPYNSLASVFRMTLRHAEARTLYKKSLSLACNANVQSNLLMDLEYDDSLSDEEVLQEHLLWAQRYSSVAESASGFPPRKPFTEKILRVGYVSGDFCRHPAGYVVHQVLSHHDKSRFRTYCYATKADIGDDLTETIRGMSDGWRDICKVDDHDAAECIRKDRIDILIDLSGHTAGQRLSIFTHRPAPIRISWLGYWNTTGLDCFDYVISDRATLTPEYERHFVEKVSLLPSSRFCFTLPSHIQEMSRPPCLERGYVTFGCFATTAKISLEALGCWSHILAQLPDARLVLKCRTFHDSATVERFQDIFAARGIDPTRIEFRERSNYSDMLKEYHGIDIALDPFPFSGAATSFDALSMGVPVISLTGRRPSGRQTYSFLKVIGLVDLAARSQEEYREKAVSLALDTSRLSKIRAELRPRLAASPLCDGVRFTNDLEKLYRQVWVDWCQEQDNKTSKDQG